MKGLIELSNFVVETVSSKCITPSKTEGEGEVKVKMYLKCMGKSGQMYFFSMMPLYDVNLMYSTVVKLDEAYLSLENHFNIY